MKLQGVYPALVTPFAADGSVDLRGVAENIRKYNATKLAGFVALGSTGESVLLSRDEGDRVLAAVKEAAAPGKILIAGTGAESTAETLSRTKRAAELGYAFALVKTPYYYKPAYSAEVYLRHYRAVADASPIPVLLYSVPLFTGVTLETPEILALAEHKNIVGIKDSSGSMQRIGELLGKAPKDFSVLTGSAPIVYPSLTLGGAGAILALASPLPEKCAEVYELHAAGKHPEARELQLALVQASRKIASENGIAGLKYAMELRGYTGGAPRLPLLPLKEERKRGIEEIVASFHPVPASV